MKKAILAVALATILVSCNNNTASDTKAAASVETATVAPSGSIVYIQMDSLVNNYDMFNDLKSELEAKAQVIQEDLNKKGRAFESAAKDFETKINKGLLTRAQAEEQQQQLYQRQQSLEGLRQQKSMEMAEEQQVMLNKVMDAIQTYVEKYNAEHNYALILTTSGSTNTVIVGTSQLDITNNVLVGLHEEYVKSNTK